MFKPVELTTRQMAASINRLNNALSFFPNATEASKFSEVELIGLLEWSLPVTWRAKFDLDGYIPTLHSKTKWLKRVKRLNAVKSPWISQPRKRVTKITNCEKVSREKQRRTEQKAEKCE